MKTSMDDDEDVLFQNYLYRLKQPKSGRFGRLGQERWKSKYFVLCCHGNQLVLKYFSKKPKQVHSAHPQKQIPLCPSFKVEKLVNSHNRAFAVQLTAPSEQVCLSADEQTTVDMFVFLLQTQMKVRDSIKDNLVEVKTESSEAFLRIGAKGANCVLHVSPWGLTLALQQSRCVLAQWPLKSVRYYESTGQGQLMIQAGMVAPMGEGMYTFHTLPGLDNRLYDSIDHYVINTLDRVKPNRKGTSEEIEDYIREFDCLCSLTELVPSPLVGHSEVCRLLRGNWTSSLQALGLSKTSHIHCPTPNLPITNRSISSESSPALRQLSVSSSVPSSPRSPLVSNNLNRPLPSPNTPRSEQQKPSPNIQQRNSPRHRDSPGREERVSGRPPPPPPGSGPHGSARLARGSPRSAGQDSVDGGAASPSSPRGSEPQPRRHSNPANVALRVAHDTEVHPAVRKQISYDSASAGVIENNVSSAQRLSPNSPHSLSPTSPNGSISRNSCPVSPGSDRDSGAEQAAGSSHKLDAPVEDWLVSASCEDLSDHMRAVIFQKRQSKKLAASAASSTAPKETENTNNNDPEFIPPPFTNIRNFRSNADVDRHKAQIRDRSQSFDVNAKIHKSPHLRNGAHGSTASSPSIKQIRKMMSARTATKETLRKSLSNPNFLNLGSKEKLYQHRMQAPKSTAQDRGDGGKLSVQSKQKSRSLASLLPSPLRRYISKESLSHPPSSSSPSPDMRHKRQHSHDPLTDDTTDSNFQRIRSARSLREMSIKGIHFTEQSRSFRKPRSYQRSRSADPFCRNRAEEEIPVSGEDHSHQSVQAATADQGRVLSGGDVFHNDSTSSGQNNDSSGSGLKADSDPRARNAAVNGMRPLPPQSDWKIRLPSRSTSQSSC